tara:strand:+ start:290 stop:1375 length:1086 start_codon:yes stop_codon:yes gene_type:complete
MDKFFLILKKLDFFILAILLGLIYFGFKPLFATVAGTTQVTIEALAAAMGAIIGAGFTWVLLNKQSEIESLNKANDRIFQEQIGIFSETIQKIEDAINNLFLEEKSDDNIEIFQTNLMKFKNILISLQPKMLLVAKEEVDKEYEAIVEKIKEYIETSEGENLKKDAFLDEIQPLIARFARKCNRTIGLKGRVIDEGNEEDGSEISENSSNKLGKKDKGPSIISLANGEMKIYGKPKFDFGEEKNIPTRYLAYLVIKEIYEKNKNNITHFDDVEKYIKPEWIRLNISSKGKNTLFTKLEDAENKRRSTGKTRFYMSKENFIKLGDSSIIVISNQWDKYNIATLIAAIKKEHNDIWKKIKLLK